MLVKSSLLYMVITGARLIFRRYRRHATPLACVAVVVQPMAPPPPYCLHRLVPAFLLNQQPLRPCQRSLLHLPRPTPIPIHPHTHLLVLPSYSYLPVLPCI